MEIPIWRIPWAGPTLGQQTLTPTTQSVMNSKTIQQQHTLKWLLLWEQSFWTTTVHLTTTHNNVNILLRNISAMTKHTTKPHCTWTCYFWMQQIKKNPINNFRKSQQDSPVRGWCSLLFDPHLYEVVFMKFCRPYHSGGGVSVNLESTSVHRSATCRDKPCKHSKC